MQGEWGSCLFSCNSYHPFSAHLSCPLLCRYVPAGIKSKGEMCEVSPLLSVLSRVIRHWTFVFYMCCGCAWPTQIVVEGFLLFSKKYSDG